MVGYFKSHRKTPSQESLVAAANEYARQYGHERTQELVDELHTWIRHLYSRPVNDEEFVTDSAVKFAQRQAIKAAVGQIVDLLESNAPTDDIKSIIDKASRVGSIRQFGTNFGAVATDLTRLLREDAIHGTENKVPLGIRTLDDRLNGGLGAGEICVFAGPPGRGKSTMMVSCGRAAANFFAQQGKKKTVIHITMELKEIDVALKYASCLTGIPQDQVVAGNEMFPLRMADQLHLLGTDFLRVKYFSPRSVTAEEIRWFIANLQAIEEVTPGLLIVDYADKIKGAEGYVEAGHVYEALVQIGDQFGIPVITGTQINREWAYEDLIDNRGVASSWAKVEVADVIGILCQSTAEREMNVMRIHWAKVRRGQGMGLTPCNWNGALSYIWEMSPSEMHAYQEQISKK
jgi:replicative DNA helicase